jgi:hypothetical protein
MMFAAVTDHVFIDGGHTLDLTNKAFECLEHVGTDAAAAVLPTMVAQTTSASRDEETSEWRHPYDLAALVRRTDAHVADAWRAGEPQRRAGAWSDDEVAALAWEFLGDDPDEIVGALLSAMQEGASGEHLGRSVAYAAALRIVRFHTQNDHADWNTVHHAFTAANALHQALARNTTPELLRGVVHGALRVYLDRFLNVPAARLPTTTAAASLDALGECWDVQGAVNEAGEIVYGFLRGGGDPSLLIATIGGALLREDVEFHWYQVFEAGVRQFRAWPPDSEEGALVLTGIARFLAAHTPTRRELSRVVEIATRLRRGEDLYEEAEPQEDELSTTSSSA